MSNVAIESPELALVDPELRARARLATVVPGETPGPAVPPSRSNGPSPLPAPEKVSGPLEDGAISEAVRRLGELSELEPTTRPPRSAKLLSFAFATICWGTLALVLAELQPWRL